MSNAPNTSQQNSLVVDENNPWPGLVSFTEGASAYFYGRNEEKATLFRLVARETLSVVFGKSGLGKTSLLQAGLFPELRRSRFLPVYLRLRYGEGQPSLAEQTLSALQSAAEKSGVAGGEDTTSSSLWSHFQNKQSSYQTADGEPLTPVLVFDQFEEIFTLGRKSPLATEAFFTELECLIDNHPSADVESAFTTNPDLIEQYDFDRRSFKIILSLREDYLPELESRRTQLRGLDQNRFRVQRMNTAQALSVALDAGRGLIDEQAAKRVVRNLSSGSESTSEDLRVVEPALLSVVLRELNSRRIKQNAGTITSEMVTVAEDILSQFYLEKTEDVPLSTRAVLESSILSDSGRFRVQSGFDDLISAGVPAAILENLVDRRILRFDERFGARVVELTHDRLVPVVREQRELRAEAAERKRMEAARSHAEAEKRDAQKREQEAKRQLQRSRLVAALFGLLAIVALAALIWAIQAEQVSSKAQAEAVASKERAQSHLSSAIETADELSSGVLNAAASEMRITSDTLIDLIESLETSLDRLADRAGSTEEIALKRFEFELAASQALFRYGKIAEGNVHAKSAQQLLSRIEASGGLDEESIQSARSRTEFLVAQGLLKTGHLTQAKTLFQNVYERLETANLTQENWSLRLCSVLALGEIAFDFLDTDSVSSYQASVLTLIGEGEEPHIKPETIQNQDDFEYDISLARSRLAYLLHEEDPLQARSLSREAIATLKQLSDRSPQNLRYKTDLADTLRIQAQSQYSLGKHRLSLDYLNQARGIYDTLLSIDSANISWSQIKADSLLLSGVINSYDYNHEGAHADLIGAESLLSNVLSKQPDNYRAALSKARSQYMAGRLTANRFNNEWLKENPSDFHVPTARNRFLSSIETLDELKLRSGELSIAGLFSLDAATRFTVFCQIVGLEDSAALPPEEAELELETLYSHSPYNSFLNRFLAIVATNITSNLTYQGNTDAAIQLLELSYDRLALAYEENNSPRSLADLIVLLNSKAYMHQSKGDLNLVEEAYSDAVDLAAPILAINPNLPLVRERATLAQYWRGGLRYKEGDWKPALEDLLAVIETTRNWYGFETKGQNLLTHFQKRAFEWKEELEGRGISIGSGLSQRIQESSTYNIASFDHMPLMQGSWRTLSQMEGNALIRNLLGWLDSAPAEKISRYAKYLDKFTSTLIGEDPDKFVSAIRVLKLPFYEDAILVEAQISSTSRNSALLTFIEISDEDGTNYVHLTGKSPPIHATNQDYTLDIQQMKNAAEYMRYFCSALHGDEGAFKLIESVAEVRFTDESDDTARAVVSSVAKPIELRRESEDEGYGWRVKATVWYSTALFEADFSLHPNGMVEMLSDNPIAGDLPVSPERFANYVRVTQEDSVDALMREGRWSAAQAILQQRIGHDPTSDDFEKMIYCQIFSRDFTGAFITSELGLSDRRVPLLWSKRAHALLFLSRVDEAKAIYFEPELADVVVSKNDTTWTDKSWPELIAFEFETLKEQGLSHPAFPEILKELGISESND